jgi:hypothetical protein
MNGATPEVCNAGEETDSTNDEGYDALFFVHGFNCGLEHAAAAVGQLCAFGSFPQDIRPIIFGWPCTSGPFYSFVRLIIPFLLVLSARTGLQILRSVWCSPDSADYCYSHTQSVRRIIWQAR